MAKDFLTQYTLTFVIYAFIGYICEVIYCSIGQRKLVNRGFLYGPWLPIYGCGGLIVEIFLVPLKKYPLLVFVLGMLLTSVVEYIGSWGLEKIFSIKLWDYSRYKLNINGRVCLLNSTLFGVMSVALVYLVQPYIASFINLIPEAIRYNLGDVLRILFAIDLTMSTIKMSAFQKALKEAREKARKVEEKAKEYALEGKMEISQEYRKRMMNELDDNKAKFSSVYKRILDAFPSATSKRSEVKDQLKNIRAWAKERLEASKEYKENIKNVKAQYKEQVKEINNKKGK